MYMKSRQDDALMISRAYNLIINEWCADYESMGCTECGSEVDVHASIPAEMTEPAESNYPDDSEVNMAMAELYKIEKYANSLAQLLQHVPALEGWTASKITKAADYLGSVFHKLDYDINGYSMHNTGYEDAMEDGE